MAVIGHPFHVIALLVQELGVEIDPNDILSIRIALDYGVRRLVVDAIGMVCLVAEREDRKKHHLRLRLFPGDHGKYLLDAGGNGLWLILAMPGVVRAYHEHDALRPIPVKLAVPAAPDKLLRAVARIAGVKHRVGLAQFLKGIGARLVPAMRYRIAEEDNVEFPAGCADLIAVVQQAIEPPVFRAIALGPDA